MRHQMMMGLVAAGFFALTGLAVAGIVRSPSGTGSDIGVAAFGGVMGVVGWAFLRLALEAHPYLELQPDSVTIKHSVHLKRPIVLRLDSVLAVMFDDRPGPRRGLLKASLATRFPVDDPSGEAAWLYPGGRGFIPTLGPRLQIPNMAIVSSTKIKLDGTARRLSAAFTENQPLLHLRRPSLNAASPAK